MHAADVDPSSPLLNLFFHDFWLVIDWWLFITTYWNIHENVLDVWCFCARVRVRVRVSELV